MKRRNRQRMWMLAAVALLVGGVAWQTRHDAATSVAASLSTQNADAVQRIALTFRGGVTQRFHREGRRWLRDDGATSPIDNDRLDELANMVAVPVFSWRPVSDFEPAKIGLAPPLATLRLDDTTFDFGEPAAVGEQRYVKVGDRIALVPLKALPRPPRDKTREQHVPGMM